jgi:hypothetical protein
MARFAASSVPDYIGNSGRGRTYKNRFTPDPLVTGAYTYDGEASGIVSLGNVFKATRANSPDYEEQAITAQKTRADEKMAIMGAEAELAGAALRGKGQVEAARARAAGEKSAAKSRMIGTIASGIGKVALGAIMMGSDEDIKHTIDEIDDALDTLRKLRPVTFYYKEEYTDNPHLMHHGFIAQEYQKVMPDATYVDSFTGKLCIDTGDLIGLLVRANQQLESRITRLEVKQALATV